MSLPESGLLSAIVSVNDQQHENPDAEDEVILHLGGLDTTDGMHPSWGDFNLVTGDEIHMTIHDDRNSDTPTKRSGLTEEELIENKKEYLRNTAKELGWELIEPKQETP